jgi:hypothetical protein
MNGREASVSKRKEKRHRKYLRRVTDLTELLRATAPSAQNLVRLADRAKDRHVLADVRNHLLLDECGICDADDERFSDGTDMPDDERAFLALVEDWFARAFVGQRIEAVLCIRRHDDLCAIVEALIVKYHPDLLPHQIYAMEPRDRTDALACVLARSRSLLHAS